MKINYTYKAGEFAGKWKEVEEAIAKAATDAVAEAGNTAKQQGRANIASAGFGTKWQNALRCEVYPAGGKPSINAAALVHHKIPYAGIFETGGTINGAPFLWLPIEANLPSSGGLSRWTPARYVAQVGPLHSVKGRDGRPLLVGTPNGAQAGRIKRLRKSGGTFERGSVALFVGIDAVAIHKRFDIVRITREQAARLPELFAKNLGV